MDVRWDWPRRLTVVFWVCSAIAVVVWALQPGYVVGWDLKVIHDAIVSLRAGHDPYADAIAAQEAFRHEVVLHPGTPVPFSYVYSPVTLPLLRIVGWLPFWLSGLLYWAAYAAAVITWLWVGSRMARESEPWVKAAVPLALFFPGLLQNDVLFSGNVAFVLYGMVLGAAWLGWRSARWMPFYAAVLIASLFKAPMLTLVVLAPLSQRRQWLAAAATGVAGIALFLGQRLVWPTMFAHYLLVLDYMFRLARDFSSSPAGLLSEALYNVAPYRVVMVVAYTLYAVPVVCVLVALSRRFLAKQFSLAEWAAVLLPGVVLLNPRIIEYDAAPLALPLALIAWRVFGGGRSRSVILITAFAAMNVVVVSASMYFAPAWRCAECVLLLSVFACGAARLWRMRVT